MKWDRVTTNDFGDVIFWDGKDVAFIISYYCYQRDRIYGNIGWIRGFSKKNGITKTCDFCG